MKNLEFIFSLIGWLILFSFWSGCVLFTIYPARFLLAGQIACGVFSVGGIFFVVGFAAVILKKNAVKR